MDPHVTLVSFSDKIGGDSFSIELDPAVFINQDFLAQQKLPLEFKGGNGVPTKEFIDSLFIEQDQLSSKTTDLVSKLIKPIVNEASRQNGPTTSSSNYISIPATAPSPPVAGKTAVSNYKYSIYRSVVWWYTWTFSSSICELC